MSNRLPGEAEELKNRWLRHPSNQDLLYPTSKITPRKKYKCLCNKKMSHSGYNCNKKIKLRHSFPRPKLNLKNRCNNPLKRNAPSSKCEIKIHKVLNINLNHTFSVKEKTPKNANNNQK